MTLSRNEVMKARKPIKPKWYKRLTLRLRYVISWIRVKLGISVWAKRVYNRPKYQVCPFHGTQMKRGGKTAQGAFYWCRVCKRYFHLEGGGTKLIPVTNKGRES